MVAFGIKKENKNVEIYFTLQGYLLSITESPLSCVASSTILKSMIKAMEKQECNLEQRGWIFLVLKKCLAVITLTEEHIREILNLLRNITPYLMSHLVPFV